MPGAASTHQTPKSPQSSNFRCSRPAAKKLKIVLEILKIERSGRVTTTFDRLLPSERSAVHCLLSLVREAIRSKSDVEGFKSTRSHVHSHTLALIPVIRDARRMAGSSVSAGTSARGRGARTRGDHRCLICMPRPWRRPTRPADWLCRLLAAAWRGRRRPGCRLNLREEEAA